MRNRLRNIAPSLARGTSSPKENYRAWRVVGQTYRGQEVPKRYCPVCQGHSNAPVWTRSHHAEKKVCPTKLRMGDSAVADGFFGEEGLLADAVRDFGEFALVGTDGGEVIDLADEIERA